MVFKRGYRFLRHVRLDQVRLNYTKQAEHGHWRLPCLFVYASIAVYSLHKAGEVSRCLEVHAEQKFLRGNFGFILSLCLVQSCALTEMLGLVYNS